MKILITTDWYKPIINGVVTSVLNLKKELEERGHEVRVLTLSRSYESYKEAGVYYIKSINLEKIYRMSGLSFSYGKSWCGNWCTGILISYIPSVSL